MGPRSLERGNLAKIFRLEPHHLASMGPRSLERGNERRKKKPEIDAKASMGPRSLERGNEVVGWLAGRATTRFNGAALARARKRNFDRKARYSLCGFNGAALARARKQPAVHALGTWDETASMGPRSL